jgi:hypothetical protein
MEKYGYTGSACIPMALDDAIERGKVKRGDLVVMIQPGRGGGSHDRLRATARACNVMQPSVMQNSTIRRNLPNSTTSQPETR